MKKFNIINILNSYRYLKIFFFNKKIFKKIKIKNNNTKILCEFSGNKSNQVAFSYLINFLKNKYACEVQSYLFIKKNSTLKNFYFYIRTFFILDNFLILKSFQVDKFFLVKKDKEIGICAKNYFDQIIDSINTKQDLINLKIDNINIGDLIYDSFLKDNSIPTLNISDNKLKNYILESLNIYFFWKNYFKKNVIKAVIISDTTYVSSMIARMSTMYNIETFQCGWFNIHKIKSVQNNLFQKFLFYKSDFDNLTNDQKEISMNISRARLDKRMNGGIGIDNMIYTDKTSFHSNFMNNNVLSKSKKKKILIAAHDFTDAPHAYGVDSNLFADFSDWINFLYDLSKETKYEWYIKSHPHQSKSSDDIFENFIKNKKSFIKIPKSTSHLQIAKEGIDCVLTVYGTIAWEYAYFKIPVISASKFNPHICYDFNLCAKSIQEYKEQVLNFDKYKINFNKDDIIKFYFMHNLYSRSDWLVKSFEEVINSIDGYKNLSNLNFYDYWISKNTSEINNEILNRISKFYNSEKLYMINERIIKN